jgi:D-tyrosyl-tRNA(Tyr) deacylase
MLCVLQRVTEAKVVVEGETVGSVGLGWLALVCAEKEDTDGDADWVADRVAGLRAFSDDAGKMNRAAADVGAGVLVVSQFTLAANLGKGRRPSFDLSMEPVGAERLCERITADLRQRGLTVATGRFGAHMVVHLTNDGPVTFILKSRER